MAVYNLSSLNLSKCQALQDRDVYLFPDLSKNGNAYGLWSKKVEELEKQLPGTKFIISGLLEKNATEEERLLGYDLADYLIKLDWRNFRNQTIQGQQAVKSQAEPKIVSKNDNSKVSVNTFSSGHESMPQAENWEQNINELEIYFNRIKLPTEPVRLNQCSIIIDVPKFINSHLTVVKKNNGERTYLPYLNRLQDLSEELTTKYQLI
ncbi:MAG: hypothetical protein HQ541_13660 [Mariniphaga sp.]|nr:hypothetical protein [Mariniphaga sp.]